MVQSSIQKRSDRDTFSVCKIQLLTHTERVLDADSFHPPPISGGGAGMAKRKAIRSGTSSASASTKMNGKIVKHGESKRAVRKRKAKKTAPRIDAMKPKKPPTAFFYYLEDFRKEYQEQNPDVKSMRDIGKACGEKWKTMTYEEKVKYYDIATEKRAEFDIAMANFTKRMESGEFDEYDSELGDDSEFDG